MKRIIGLFILTVALSLSSQAQKFGYVDTELILSKMEEYKAAKQEVDNLSQKWQKELEELYAGIEKMYKDYQAEEVLLTDDIKKQRQEDIMAAERKAKEYKEKKFGYDGELYKGLRCRREGCPGAETRHYLGQSCQFGHFVQQSCL